MPHIWQENISTQKPNREGMGKERKRKEDEEPIEVSNIDDFNLSNKRWNRAMDTFDKIVEEVFPGYTEYKKEENEKDRQHDSKLNKRGLMFGFTVLFLFSSMWAIAMIMGEKEMANTILQIMLGIAAGAGIASYLK